LAGGFPADEDIDAFLDDIHGGDSVCCRANLRVQI
jgi:hypothetical protein